MFVERNTQYTSFSSRKQPANAGTERKQFTENASVALLMALQQPILTHAHTKCPPVCILKATVKRTTKTLRILPPTFKPVSQQIRLLQVAFILDSD